MKNQDWEKELTDYLYEFMNCEEFEEKPLLKLIFDFIRKLLKEEYKKGFRDGYGRGRLEAVESEELYREINKEVKK